MNEKRRGWNDEQRKTIARGASALKGVASLLGPIFGGTKREAREQLERVADEVEERFERNQAARGAIDTEGEDVLDCDDSEDNGS